MSDDLQSEIQLLELSLDDLLSSPVVAPVVEAKQKVCKDCGETDQGKMMAFWCPRSKKTYLRNHCRLCNNAYAARKLAENPERYKRKVERQSVKLKHERKNNVRIERFIYYDCKNSDKKFGREFDLDQVFIKEQIAKGCQFCGETTIRMTMDRIDNDIGHIKTNVVPACIRCNYVRRDMPYKAWLRMAKSMRAARKAGEFGDWTCEIMRGTRKLRKVQKGAKVA